MGILVVPVTEGILVVPVTEGVISHPQCLDGKPPFISSPQLTFCTEYREVGCCTADEDFNIMERYEAITKYMSSACLLYIKSLLCQACSPYAAHLYSYEEQGFASPTPGLCYSYCTRLYKTCGSEALSLLSNDTLYRKSLLTREKFCLFNRISDEDYCYPELKTNPTLIEGFTKANEDSEGCMCLQKIAGGHGLVTFLESNPADPNLMYVGEQNGKIHVYKNGVKRRRLFMDLSKVVLISDFIGDERGLLGMVFHPKFAKNRRFYLYYVLRGEKGQTVRISQWLARGNYISRKSSERVLLDIPQPYFNHNGGQLLFGDDGYLYIFTGDGGGAGDPQGNAQNLESLMGKALRIDVKNRRRDSYSIPADNPFIDGTGREEIYAYGLRNSWRCSKDRGDPITGEGKGRIFCGDVGQNRYEEIDIIVKGGNYGWAAREGFVCYNSKLCGKIGEEVLPIYAYSHDYGKSITGGYVYRGCEYPTFNGNYIYGDFTSGRMFMLKEKENKWKNIEIKMCSSETCTGNWVSTYGKGITTFGTNSHGDILMSSSSDDSAHSDGASLYKLIMQPFRREDPSNCDSLTEVSSNSLTTDKISTSLEPVLPLLFTDKRMDTPLYITEPDFLRPYTTKPVLPQLSTTELVLPQMPTTEPVVLESEPAALLTVTDPGPPSIDYDIVYDPFTTAFNRRQRRLAELIAQYKALIEETEAAIREKEELIAASKAQQDGGEWNPALQVFTSMQSTQGPGSYHWSTPHSIEPSVQTSALREQLKPLTQVSSTSTRSPRRTYNWQRFSNTTPLFTTHSQPNLQSTPSTFLYNSSSGETTPSLSSGVFIRRIKINDQGTRRKQLRPAERKTKILPSSQSRSTRSPYFYLETTTQQYPWATARRRSYQLRRASVTSNLQLVTNYPLPDYLLSDSNILSQRTSYILDSFYRPPPRRLVPNNRYQLNDYSFGSVYTLH